MLNSFYYATVTSFINFRIYLTLDMGMILPRLMTELLLLAASPPSRNARWLRWKRFAWKRAETSRICLSCRGRCLDVLCSLWTNMFREAGPGRKRKVLNDRKCYWHTLVCELFYYLYIYIFAFNCLQKYIFHMF